MSHIETNESVTTEHRIVVGVDGSPCANRALEFATLEAARWGALLHVVSIYHQTPDAGSVIYPIGMIEASANAIVEASVHWAEEVEPSIVTKGDTLLAGPGPGPGLGLSEVSEGATALVVGMRGQNQVTGFLGSVSEYVVHHATCTTIVVR